MIWREPIRSDCEGNISRDQMHLLVSVPPTLVVSRLVRRMKGLTSRKLLIENRRVEQNIFGEASMGPRVFRGQHRERDGRNDRPLYRESAGRGAGPGCRLQSRAVMSAPVGFSRRAQTHRL